MKTRASILATLLLAVWLTALGCASSNPAAKSSWDMSSGNGNLVLPTDSMIELAAVSDAEMWEFSRNDPQMGRHTLPRDTSYRVVETRQWEVLGTSNGRPRDYSYTRIRTYSRESR